jgi:hypothetical protein
VVYYELLISAPQKGTIAPNTTVGKRICDNIWGKVKLPVVGDYVWTILASLDEKRVLGSSMGLNDLLFWSIDLKRAFTLLNFVK